MATTKSGVLINEYRPVGRGDYGVRVARNGFDATTAGDSNLLFNSGWPILQIVKVISRDNKVLYLDETQDIPEDYRYIDTTIEGSFIWDCSVDEKWLYLPKETLRYYDPQTFEIYFYDRQYRIYHGLGYIPMFFKSELISDVPDYFALMNVDIRQDADYPYTSKASYYDGATKNYGIKSKSRTRTRMPNAGETRGCGLSTMIQSKLVMAVKTDKSKTTSDDPLNPAPNAAWGVPKDNNSIENTTIMDYEPFAYFAGQNNGPYLEKPCRQFPANDPYGRYQLMGQDASAVLPGMHASLIVLRSPMVAPDVEEITIS